MEHLLPLPVLLVIVYLAAPVSSQNFEDPTVFFKDMSKDWDVRLRGNIHISICVKRLMNCWDIIKADIVCSDNELYYESGCMLMRNKRCEDTENDRFGSYTGTIYKYFAMYEEKCQTRNKKKGIQ